MHCTATSAGGNYLVRLSRTIRYDTRANNFQTFSSVIRIATTAACARRAKESQRFEIVVAPALNARSKRRSGYATDAKRKSQQSPSTNRSSIMPESMSDYVSASRARRMDCSPWTLKFTYALVADSGGTTSSTSKRWRTTRTQLAELQCSSSIVWKGAAASPNH